MWNHDENEYEWESLPSNISLTGITSYVGIDSYFSPGEWWTSSTSALFTYFFTDKNFTSQAARDKRSQDERNGLVGAKTIVIYKVRIKYNILAG
jgi:hypothetical protein